MVARMVAEPQRLCRQRSKIDQTGGRSMSGTADATPAPVSYGRRLTMLATERPDGAAIIFAPQDGEERRLSWSELERRANQVARLLADRGVGERDTVVIGFPNNPEHVIISFATWKLGGMILTLRAALPPYERDAILDLAHPRLVVADWPDIAYPLMPPADLARAEEYPDDPLPDRVPEPGRALASGGSTGRPKIIVTPGPLQGVPEQIHPFLQLLGFRCSWSSARSITARPGSGPTAASSTATRWY
jgi:bile acid-coenzyme A ligase